MPLPLLTIALPVGVSFFTFQAISYVVDVKRAAGRAREHDRRRALPELLPAPGRRARSCARASSCRSWRRRATRSKVAVGSGLVLIGARAGQEGRDRRLPRARRSSTRCSPCRVLRARRTCWLAAYAYTAQIYCDFSGYTDIAIGLALLMGYVFPQNFCRPYRVARLPRLLAPLAHDAVALPARLPLHPARRQPRGRLFKTYRNLMLTMLLGGLWHGAAWTFVLWGAFHGAGLVRSSTRSAAGCRAPGVAAVGDHLPPRRVRLDPVPLAEPGRGRRRSSRACSRPARRRCGRPPVIARDRGRDRPAAAAGKRGRATSSSGSSACARSCSPSDSPS